MLKRWTGSCGEWALEMVVVMEAVFRKVGMPIWA